MCSSGGETSRKGTSEKPTAFSTKVTSRSVSLESVRETVKRAWMDDRLDESHRKLLAQAAYEEWCLKKEKELRKKRQDERTILMKAKESLQNDFQRKKEKSEEEFKKWLLRKRTKRKNEKENGEHEQDRLIKTKESEKAYTKWKQTKEKELKKRKLEKQKEEEERMESEKQKKQKKLNAEKAFQKWKTKLEEAERLADKKTNSKKKKQQEEEERKKRKEGSLISFQMWKKAKDEQMKEKIKHIREADKVNRQARLLEMEERMYEAEQAFEEWLEKVDLRQKQYSNMCGVDQKIIPWIPA